MNVKIICAVLLVCLGDGISTALAQRCADISQFCSKWPDSYCQTYKNYMKTNCARKCGYCTAVPSTSLGAGVCSDKYPRHSCVSWRRYGYCAVRDRYHSFMKDNCKKTCGLCGSCSVSNKLAGCSFDSDSCNFVDVPFDDSHDFVLKSSGGLNGKGYISSSGSGNADLILPLELLVPHNSDLGDMCMQFYYRIRSTGQLTVYQVQNTKNYPKATKLRLSDTQEMWKKATMTFRASQHYQILLRSTPNSGTVDIDNIRFCESCI